MNGKGSMRRPAAVSPKQLAANWRRTFGTVKAKRVVLVEPEGFVFVSAACHKSRWPWRRA